MLVLVNTTTIFKLIAFSAIKNKSRKWATYLIALVILNNHI